MSRQRETRITITITNTPTHLSPDQPGYDWIKVEESAVVMGNERISHDVLKREVFKLVNRANHTFRGEFKRHELSKDGVLNG